MKVIARCTTSRSAKYLETGQNIGLFRDLVLLSCLASDDTILSPSPPRNRIVVAMFTYADFTNYRDSLYFTAIVLRNLKSNI